MVCLESLHFIIQWTICRAVAYDREFPHSKWSVNELSFWYFYCKTIELSQLFIPRMSLLRGDITGTLWALCTCHQIYWFHNLRGVFSKSFFSFLRILSLFAFFFLLLQENNCFQQIWVGISSRSGSTHSLKHLANEAEIGEKVSISQGHWNL